LSDWLISIENFFSNLRLKGKVFHPFFPVILQPIKSFNMTSILNRNTAITPKTDNLSRFVHSKSIGDVIQKVKPEHQELLDLPVTCTMEEAFDLLLTEDIMSIPIYHSENNEKEYVAIVSALDLLKLLSAKVRVTNREKNNSNPLPCLDRLGK
jgi:hypothetical protein